MLDRLVAGLMCLCIVGGCGTDFIANAKVTVEIAEIAINIAEARGDIDADKAAEGRELAAEARRVIAALEAGDETDGSLLQKALAALKEYTRQLGSANAEARSLHLERSYAR
jgi:hypothetical protein